MGFDMVLLVFLAGFASGVVNAIAGGGTFITFGTLMMAGMPAITANATSAIAQLPGYLASSLSYRREILGNWRTALGLLAVSFVGGIIGGALLLAMNNKSFSALVPWLLLFATVLFVAGPYLPRSQSPAAEVGPGKRAARGLLQLVTAIYGGFFGAGMGIMMLATLGLTEGSDYHRLNALKNLLSISIALMAVVVFIGGGVIDWSGALLLIPGATLGGFAGIYAARRVRQAYIRWIVTGIAALLTAYYFLR